MIGIISDTHDNMGAIEDAVQLFNKRNVELLLHAGDIVSPFTARVFGGLKMPMKCVYGNNDGDHKALAAAYEGIADFKAGSRIIEYAGKKIFMSHAELSLYPDSPDVIIFGHTHETVIKEENGSLYINPGEAGGWLTGRRSVAFLYIDKMEAEIIEF